MTIYENFSDEELITVYRDGDERAADYLMDKYKNLVKQKAKSMFIIGADKDDLIQEGMIGLYKALRDFDPGRDASFITFADLCVARQMYKAVEAGNRKKHSPLNSYISLYENVNTDKGEREFTQEGASVAKMIIAMAGSNNPEDDFIDRENTASLEQKIYDLLSELERQVLNLYLTGMNYVEIARVLGKDDKSIDNALSRIKTKVKKILLDKK